MKQLNHVWVLAVLGAAVIIMPSAASADIMALTSPDQINATPFTFDGFGGPVTPDTNTALIAAGAGFIFPNAGAGGGEFIVDRGSGDFVLDSLGGLFGYDAVVEFQFDSPVEAFGIDYDTSTPLSLVAFDVEDNPINADWSIVTPLDSTIGFFGIASTDGNIASVLIHDSLGSFTLDNLRAGELATIPLPASWALCIVGFGLVGWIRARGKT
ncbi:MAG: hypothetical protein JSU86_00145 [Phycisphaerales bacterium]|nr:MAG: hypothetical protein JSU86_00145 [Phycisphaerales bacterium]